VGEAPGRVLGVDLGLKRTGLAVSDELRLTTRALETLTPKSRAEDVAHLRAVCVELEVRDVVVGYPTLPRSGEEGGMARRARGFAEVLLDAVRPLGTRVHLVEESGSSREASARLVASGVKRSKRRNLDEEAARVLIERFLEGGEAGPPLEDSRR
jgi:putative holliday junction resolvase